MEDSNYWQRFNRRRITRRALLSGAATTALGGAAALVVGCGGGDSTSTPEGSRTPRPTFNGTPMPGGTVTQGRPLTVLGIDPHQDLTGLDIDQLIYPYLYSWNPVQNVSYFNNLLTSIETPDPVTFIMHVRQGVKQAPFNFAGAGEELTSEDVKASFVRRGTSISAPDKRFPRLISKDPNLLASVLQTPDTYTFKFQMADVFVPAIREMANPTWAIVGKKALEALGNRSLTQVGYGAGPYMLDQFNGNQRITLKKNPNYFIQGQPLLDEINIIVITENSSLLSAFKQGQHDICGAVLTKEEWEDFGKDDNYVTASQPSLFYPCVHMKMVPPFDDVRVREAIDISINRDQVIQVIDGGDGQYNGPIQWPQVAWALPQDELRTFYKYDPDLARQRLAEAGYAGGFSAKMKLPKISGVSQIADEAALLKDQWSEVGINITLEEVELGTFIGSTLLPGNFQMAFFPNLPYDEPDRPLSFYSSLGVTGAGNWNNYTNPDFDALYNAQAKETDPVKRKQIITQAQELIIKEHGPQITITGGNAYSAHWNYVHLPYELGQDPGTKIDPYGCDEWTEHNT